MKKLSNKSNAQSHKSVFIPRKPYEPLKVPEIPNTNLKERLLLAVLAETGSLELAMSCASLSRDEASRIPEQYLKEAQAEYNQQRIADARMLVTRARDVALISENPKDMLAVAEMLAPECFVYPQEKSRSRAKQEHSQPQVMINVGLTDMAERLQRALRELGPANE